MRIVLWCAAVAFISSAGAASATNYIQNGDFSTGTLAAWNVSATPNGQYSYSIGSSVSTYANLAAIFVAGQVNYTIGEYEGVILSQDISVSGGKYEFSAIFADFNPDQIYANGGGDQVTAYVDGQEVDRQTFGFLQPLQIRKAGLNGTFDLSSGEHTVSITIERPYLPYTQVYVTAVELTQVVPEPATWSLMIFGFGLTGGALRSRRRAAAR